MIRASRREAGIADVWLRRSSAVIGWPYGRGWKLRNYVLGTTINCRAATLAAIDSLDRELRVSALLRELEQGGELEPAKRVARLLEAGVLVAPGSALDRLERRWARAWRWGPVCAAFHRSLRDLRFASEDEAKQVLVARARRRPPPDALRQARGPRRELPPPRLDRGILADLARRETIRELSGEPLSARELADVLYSGLGVRAVVDNVVHGKLPLKLAPSGGACNPIDGYVCVYGVDGLEPGAYLYSGLHRDLVLVSGPPPPPRSLLGGQPWAEGAAAVVFLVASFGRAWWKYEHELSYRMVTLEAGHIAQNMLVTASCLGLGAWPSGAVADSAVEHLIRASGPDRAVLYAVVLGRRRHPVGQRRTAARAAAISRPSGKSASAASRRNSSRTL